METKKAFFQPKSREKFKLIMSLEILLFRQNNVYRNFEKLFQDELAKLEAFPA
jgi:hypothetical protein